MDFIKSEWLLVSFVLVTLGVTLYFYLKGYNVFKKEGLKSTLEDTEYLGRKRQFLDVATKVNVKDDAQLSVTRGKHRPINKDTRLLDKGKFESTRLDSKASELNDCDWY